MSASAVALPAADALLTEPTDQLADYRPGKFFFSSPNGILLADGVAGRVATGPWGRAAEQISAELAACAEQGLGEGRPDGPVAVGVVPFDLDRPGRLGVPASLRESGPFESGGPFAGRPAAPARQGDRPAAVRPIGRAGPGAGSDVNSDVQVESLPTPDGYAAAVAEAVRRMRAGELDKVVLARMLRVPGPVDLAALLRRLAERDPHAYVFAADLPAQADSGAPGDRAARRRTLVGASPELLISRRGSLVVSNPLAGSAPRSPDPAEDRARAAALLASAKNAHEHALVVAAVADALRPFCLGLDVPAAPSLIRTASMWHLSTRISGWLADPSISSLQLAAALHPTPAICGWPVDTARAVIGELEPFDRDCYTGVVGWCDAAGNGEWALAIRCAQIGDDGALQLYAGAGIVAESVPADELAETSAKFRTLGSAMGLKENL